MGRREGQVKMGRDRWGAGEREDTRERGRTWDHGDWAEGESGCYKCPVNPEAEVLVPVHFESGELGTLNVYGKCSPTALHYYWFCPLDPTIWRMFIISALIRLFYVPVGV